MDEDARLKETPDQEPEPQAERRQPTWRESELQRLVADIAARLRKSCAELSDKDFSKLVLDIAERRMRFELMDPNPGRPRNARR